jgi:hypothetical protein
MQIKSHRCNATKDLEEETFALKGQYSNISRIFDSYTKALVNQLSIDYYET